jgi:hypothetical protein
MKPQRAAIGPEGVLKHLSTPGRALRPIEKTGMVVGGVFLVVHWAMVVYYLASGDLYGGYSSRLASDSGTYLFVAMVFGVTIFWAVVLWRHWLLRLFGRRTKTKAGHAL